MTESIHNYYNFKLSLKLMKFIIRRFKGIIIAIKGMFYLLKNEDSIKVQSIVCVFFVLLGCYFEINKTEWIIHVLLIGFILTTEGLNTVAEKICDLINPEYDERIKIIKDIAAGAVSFAVISSLIILFIIYLPYFSMML